MKTFFAGLFFMLHFLVASQPLDTTFIIPQIDSLMQRCQDHVANSEFEQALQAVEQAERIILEQLGPHTVQYAIACFHHGRTFHFSGEYDAAKTWYEKALPFWENNVSEKYTEYVSNLYNLSLIYGGIGWHEKEEALYLNVLSLCRDVFGKTNPNYSKSLVNLANLYTDHLAQLPLTMLRISIILLFYMSKRHVLKRRNDFTWRQNPFGNQTVKKKAQITQPA